MQYQSRWRELLMLHQAEHGTLPPENADDAAGSAGSAKEDPRWISPLRKSNA